MRRGITLGFAAALTLTLAACGGNATTSDAETTGGDTSAEAPADGAIVVWVDENRKAAIDEAAAAYTEETGVEVQTVQRTFEDIRADFLAQVPTGEGPDITIGAHDWLGEFVTNGAVAPVDLGEKSGDFNEVAVQAYTYDGQVYGVPYSIENVAIIRNADLVAEPTPDTFDAMVEAGRAAGTQFPFVVQIGETGDPYHMYAFQTSFGAEVFAQDEAGSYTSELTLGGEPGHAFAQWLADQGPNGTGVLNTSLTADIAKQAFIDGNTPFILGGPWLIQDFEGMNVAVDPIPSAGGEPARPFVGVQGFYVSARSENQIAAADFLVNYVGSEETQTALFEVGNRPPALIAAADAAASDELVAGFAAAGENALPQPSIPEMGAVWNFWGVTEASILSGTNEPVAGWDKMVADIEAEIAQ